MDRGVDVRIETTSEIAIPVAQRVGGYPLDSRHARHADVEQQGRRFSRLSGSRFESSGVERLKRNCQELFRQIIFPAGPASDIPAACVYCARHKNVFART